MLGFTDITEFSPHRVAVRLVNLCYSKPHQNLYLFLELYSFSNYYVQFNIFVYIGFIQKSQFLHEVHRQRFLNKIVLVTSAEAHKREKSPSEDPIHNHVQLSIYNDKHI